MREGFASIDDRLAVELDTEDGRYHRQTLISWWDQGRLSDAKILVVGAGALGNELVKNLVLLGVGTVVVIDLDQVENSNLSRCVLFRQGDDGRDKASVVAAAAHDLNPQVTVVPLVGDVRTTIGLGAFATFDVVLGGLDNREARLFVNQACWKAGTPWVDGAIEGLMGVVRSFVPPDSACYECTMGQRDYELLAARRACSLLTREQMLEGKVPTTATSASVVAGMQVQEAVKLLHRDVLEYTFAGSGFAYNGLTHDSYVVRYPRQEECLSHDSYDLDAAHVLPAGVTLQDVLHRAITSLGAGAVLELEQELVLGFECRTCEHHELVLLPVVAVSAEQAACPGCGGERRLDFSHVVDGRSPALERTPAEIGLPPGDVLTARNGPRREHFVLAGADALLSATTDVHA